MNIRSKLFYGYVLLAVFVLVVGIVGLRATHSVGEDFDHAINQTQPVLDALQDMRFHTVQIVAASYRAAHAPHRNAEGDADIFAQLDAAAARHLSLVHQYFPDERAEAGEIAEKLADFKAAAKVLQAGELSGPEGEAALDALSEMAESILDGIAEAAAGEEKEFAARQQQVDEQIKAHEHFILTVSLLAILSTLLGGFYLARRLARPIVALRDAALRLGGGQLDTRVPVAGGSEVGELAQSFNSMAERLASSMVSRDYVEDIIESMAEGMVVIDGEGQVQRVNQAFRKLFRVSADYSFAGRPLADYFPDFKLVDSEAGARGAGPWLETVMHTAPGDQLAVALSVSRLHSDSLSAGKVILVQDITERKQHEEHLNYLARYDALTGLPNRTLLLDHLGQALTRLPWKKTHTAILFCDLDRFKFVNDTLGHGVGDVLLQRVAGRLVRCVRAGDIVGRWSGDEFVVILNDLAHAEDVAALAEKVVTQLGEPIQVGPHELYVTVSVGVSLAPAHSSRADELVKCADMAMFAAKAEGKNTYRLYTPGMAEHSQERLRLEGALRHALQAGEQLQVHYQAQRRLDGRLIGFEALVRWRHPELGLISPAQFLPMAEEAGLMAAIDETVLHTACRQARQWQDEGLHGLRIAVNVSNHLFGRGDLPQLVEGVLSQYGLPPSCLELELTEAIVMTDIESSIGTMHLIRRLGVELSIDDFGTGYSSLSHLKRCPIQMLKIDRSFVNDVMTDPNDAAITEAIVALAHKMGIQVLAEGVENEEQLEALRSYGCDAIQGYFLSKPIPPELLPELLVRLGHPSARRAADAVATEDEVAAVS